MNFSRDPDSWGPAMWQSLHCMAHHLPSKVPLETQKSFQAMVESLPQLLPCKACGDHLRQHLADDPVGPNLGTRDSIEQWLIRLHNAVNVQTGKRVLSQAEAVLANDEMCGPAGRLHMTDHDSTAHVAEAEQVLPKTAVSASLHWLLALLLPPRALQQIRIEHMPRKQLTLRQCRDFLPDVHSVLHEGGC
mmetsp:Transcript_60016/g.113071  ORF Transcript_60016/g.113071 Transcript_60016/m.113071 type:complete len:190 (+) Transcript_60016:167-736(+)